MQKVKKTLISALAMVTACGMLSASVMAEEAPAVLMPEPIEEAPAEASPAEEVPAEPEAAAPEAILGAWTLYQVFEVQEGADPVLLAKEENESVYGADVSIYNFDDMGVAHHITFDAGESLDLTGTWERTEENVYVCQEEPESLTLRYVPGEDMLHRSYQDAERTLDFVYSRAFVGIWKVDKVQALIEGDAPLEFSREEYQSLYGNEGDALQLNPDRTAKNLIREGEETVETDASWRSEKPNTFVLSEEGTEMAFTYFSADDAIFRDVLDDSPEAPFAHLRFIYKRVNADGEPVQPEILAQPETQLNSDQTAGDYTEYYYDDYSEETYYPAEELIVPEAEESGVYPTEDPAVYPTEDPAVYPAEDPSAYQAEDPAVYQAEEPGVYPTEDPAVYQAEDSAVYQAEDPAAYLAVESVQEPAIEPVIEY